MAVGRINGDRINVKFCNKKMYGRFAAPKKTGHNNEVTILLRWL